MGFYVGPRLMHERLVIPIHTASGELIAYCGRSVDHTVIRYQPSKRPEEPVFIPFHESARYVFQAEPTQSEVG